MIFNAMLLDSVRWSNVVLTSFMFQAQLYNGIFLKVRKQGCIFLFFNSGLFSSIQSLAIPSESYSVNFLQILPVRTKAYLNVVLVEKFLIIIG